MTNDSALKPTSSLGNCLLRIAVIADTHLTEADGVCNSPFAVNKLANERLRYVVDSINQLAPDFTIHLGDIVHPVPAVPALYKQAVGCFREQIANLDSELLLVPGNHDVGDKPIDWGPAGVVCEEHIALWEQYFGPHYQVLERQACHFITLNAQLMNTGFASEQAQREWLENYVAQHAGERFFINLHYPPYLHHVGEREHYDNIAEPARSWLLSLLEQYRVEALFAGHVHHFWHYRHASTDCYLLPSTAFVRQDYSEMFRAVPPETSEFGRNDVDKLGYLLLEIYQHGHLCRPIRTQGALLADAAATIGKPSALRLPFPPHPRQQAGPKLGFDMRKDWLAAIEIPPSGGLDEFDRKTVRNDYPLMALWEMGVSRLRIPRADLESHSQHLYGLYAQGMRFTLFSYDVPDDKLLALVQAHQTLLDAWEIAIPLDKVDSLTGVLPLLGNGPAVYLSKLRSKADVEQHSGTYYHVINHGFAVDDAALIENLCQQPIGKLLAGFVFRIGHTQAVAQAALQADALAQGLGRQASLHVRMGGENPAQPNGDECWVAVRVAACMACAHALAHSRLFIDTLVDVDRGYFPRMGVLDALCNPRQGFHVLRNLNALLSQLGSSWSFNQQASTGDYLYLQSAEQVKCLVLLQGRLPDSYPVGRAWDLLQAQECTIPPVGGSTSDVPLLCLLSE